MPVQALDVLIVGAGFGGLYALYKLRGMGLEVLALAAAESVGGTWWANRYPGARVDIQSLEYSYSFSEALQQDWHWTERYAAQPELLRYANHVADRFDLRRDIRLHTRVSAAHFDEVERDWRVSSADGGRWTARFLVLAGHRAAVVAEPAGVRRCRGWNRAVRRASAAFGRLAGAAAGAARPGYRRDRYRLLGRAAHSDPRRADELTHRVPAHRRVRRAGAQRPARSRVGGPHQGG